MKKMPDSEKTPTDLWGGRHPQLGKISILPSLGTRERYILHNQSNNDIILVNCIFVKYLKFQ